MMASPTTPSLFRTVARTVFWLGLVVPTWSYTWEMVCNDEAGFPDPDDVWSSAQIHHYLPGGSSFARKFVRPSNLCSAENVGCYCTSAGQLKCGSPGWKGGHGPGNYRLGSTNIKAYCGSICACWLEPEEGDSVEESESDSGISDAESGVMAISDSDYDVTSNDVPLSSSTDEGAGLTTSVEVAGTCNGQICNHAGGCQSSCGSTNCMPEVVHLSNFPAKYPFGLCLPSSLGKRAIASTTDTGGVPSSGCVCNCTYISVACCSEPSGIVHEDASNKLGGLTLGTSYCGADGTSLSVPANTYSQILANAALPNVTVTVDGVNTTALSNGSFGEVYNGPTLSVDYTLIFGADAAPNTTLSEDNSTLSAQSSGAATPDTTGIQLVGTGSIGASSFGTGSGEPLSSISTPASSASSTPGICHAAGDGCWTFIGCGDSDNCYCGNALPSGALAGFLSTKCIANPGSVGPGGNRKRAAAPVAAPSPSSSGGSSTLSAGSVCPCNCTYISGGCCGSTDGIVYEAPTARVAAVLPPAGSCCNTTSGAIQSGAGAGNNGTTCP